ncbi:MAG: inorganic diphosphatase [Nitrospinota bacterium]|nr:inorganic diphosphatase [Nitrospinota bacterium]MDH5757263.1 inorganic diphosphatase [Nitrospinota bacterium]
MMTKRHPWFDIDPGPKAPNQVHAFIEIERNSRLKLELEKQTGFLIVDRILHGAVHYPHSYGFIPQTYCDDQDPLDIFVLCSETIPSGTIVEAKVIGAMRMTDQGELDDKIIAVAMGDPAFDEIFNITQLPIYQRSELKKFFEEYKTLEKKEVIVEDFMNHDEAAEAVRQSMDSYQREAERLKAKYGQSPD